jgi:hypothetical protein
MATTAYFKSVVKPTDAELRCDHCRIEIGWMHLADHGVLVVDGFDQSESCVVLRAHDAAITGRAKSALILRLPPK